jgi:hypothetical protein
MNHRAHLDSDMGRGTSPDDLPFEACQLYMAIGMRNLITKSAVKRVG